MSSPADTRIAGSKTVADWQAFRAKLAPGADKGLWQEAARDYFHERLSTRYLEPIRAIQEHRTLQGEGFSMVAIQCTLVEFLESTARGLSYRYIRPGQRLGQHEYSNSSRLFVSFLWQRQPFAKEFLTQVLARDFYVGVRCGLLHEARTKDGWTIWGSDPSGKIICPNDKVVYR